MIHDCFREVKYFMEFFQPQHMFKLVQTREYRYVFKYHMEWLFFTYVTTYISTYFYLIGTEESLVHLPNITTGTGTSTSNSSCVGPSNSSSRSTNKSTPGRRKKPSLSSRERNVRRIESNERERLRMHGLNEAFQVRRYSISAYHSS